MFQQPVIESNLPFKTRLVWEDIPDIRIWGDTTGHKLHTATHQLGRVAIVGDCFVSSEVLQTTVDSALTEEKYELLTYFPGTYTVLIRQPGETTIMRSVVGCDPVYFARDSNRPLASSRASAVTGERQLRPDLAQVAANLVMFGIGETAIFGNDSLFHGVKRLRGGQALVSRDNMLTVYAYESLAAESGLARKAVTGRLADALRQSIVARMQEGPVSADLSGGLDSGAMAALILENLGENEALSVFFKKSSAIESGDISYVEDLVAHNARLNLSIIDSVEMLEEVDPSALQYPEELSIALAPPIMLARMAYYKQLQRQGELLHITGAGGDEVVGVGMAYLPDLLQDRQYLRFMREGMQWARINNVSPITIWKNAIWLAKVGPSGVLRMAAEKVLHPPDNTTHEMASPLLFWQPTGPGLKWLTDSARQLLAAKLLKGAEDIQMPERVGDFITHERLQNAGYIQFLNTFYSSAVADPGTKPVSPQSPFLDNNIARIVQSLRSVEKGSPYQTKQLLIESLGDTLPRTLVERKTKGDYDIGLRAIHHKALRSLSQILDRSHLAALGIIDPARVRETLRHIDTVSDSEFWALTQLLSTESWLDFLYQGGNALDAYALPKQERQQGDARVKEKKVTIYPDDNYDVPDHVRAIATDSGTLVVLNQRTNNFRPLAPTQSHMFRAIAATGSIDQAIVEVSKIYPNVDSAMIAKDMQQNMEQFLSWGLVRPVREHKSRLLPSKPRTPRFVSEETVVAVPNIRQQQRLRERVFVAAAFAGTMALKRIAPSYRMPLLGKIQGIRAGRPATVEEARAILESMQNLKYIGRIACLEAPYAAAFALALRGLKVEWHVGVSTSPPPFAAHSWIEAEGQPVRSRLDSMVSGRFQSFFENGI